MAENWEKAAGLNGALCEIAERLVKKLDDPRRPPGLAKTKRLGLEAAEAIMALCNDDAAIERIGESYHEASARREAKRLAGDPRY